MILFTLLTFAASWSLWAAASWSLGGDFAHPGRLAPLGNALYLLGVFVPALVGLALTFVRGGSTAAKALLGRVTAWSVDARWYAFAILYFPLVKVAVALANRVTLGEWPAFSGETIPVMLIATVLSTPVQAGEEIGWRGVLLPRLTVRIGRPAASIVGGVSGLRGTCRSSSSRAPTRRASPSRRTAQALSPCRWRWHSSTGGRAAACLSRW